MKKRLFAALTVILIICLCITTVYAENGDAENPVPETEEQPTQENPPEQPEPAPPAEEQTPATEQTPAPPQSTPTPEDYGTVDLVIYTYTEGGLPGSGYTVKIDETIQKTNDEGRAAFPNLIVERHTLSITNSDGTTRSVTLYMSRSNATRTTGVAQDGTCGLDIARGVNQVYMTIDYVPDEPLSIKLSENKPTPPSVAPSASASAAGTASAGGLIVPNPNSDTQYQTKKIYAVFNDADGKGISGLKISVKTNAAQSLAETTNSSGKIELENIPYGISEWSFEDDEYDSFTLELRKGVQTGVISGEGDNLSVSASTRAQKIYLTFVKDGNGFILQEASESAGGMSGMLLVLIIIVIVVGVIVTVVVVKKFAGRKPQPVYPKNEDYRNTRNIEDMMPRSTGGNNKLNDNINGTKKRDSDFDDRYRM